MVPLADPIRQRAPPSWRNSTTDLCPRLNTDVRMTFALCTIQAWNRATILLLFTTGWGSTWVIRRSARCSMKGMGWYGSTTTPRVPPRRGQAGRVGS